MLAIAAAVIFAIAFLLSATTTATNAVFSPTSLLLACACRKPRPGHAQCHVDKRVRGFEVAVALTEGGCWVFNGE
jgi:membrane protein implicated in regulation of membrane protease activity